MADETPMSDERLEELRRVGEPHPSGKFHLLGVEELVREIDTTKDIWLG